MNSEEKAIKTLLKVIISIVFVFTVFGIAMLIPGSRAVINEYVFQIERVDQETDYQNRKMVEDTARAMITNYTSYKLEWEAYKTFPTDSQEYIRAINARTAANNVASNYNNYLTQNSYIFKGNLPYDIPFSLPYLT